MQALNGQLELVERLDALGREKEACLVRGEAQSLGGVLEQEEETLAELNSREDRRRQASAAVARALGLTQAEPTLRELAQSLGSPVDAAELQRFGSAITARVQEIARRNERLRQLLEQQIHYTDFMMNLLLGATDGAQFYNMQGARAETPSSISKLDLHA